MQTAIEIAESIARDTSCAQGEFKNRVLAIIPYLDGIDRLVAALASPELLDKYRERDAARPIIESLQRPAR